MQFNLIQSAEAEFCLLYQHHYDWINAWLRKKLGCHSLASDLAQDTFLHILTKNNIDQIREKRAFVTTVAHGLMVNHLRRKAIEQAYIQALSYIDESQHPSPESTLINIETLVRIDEMLSSLSPNVKKAFLLLQLEGLSHAEIASELNVSVSSVRKYIYKAVIHCSEYY